MKRKFTLGTIIVLAVLLLVFSESIINFIINIKWFNEVGYTKVFLTKIFATLKLMIPIFFIVYLGIWLYYRSLKKSVYRIQKVQEVSKKRKNIERTIFIVADVIVSLFISFSFAYNYWYRILQFENAVSFNKKDPLFGIDISFFVFRLPLIETLYGVLMTLLVLLVIITVITYAILMSKDKLMSGNFNGTIQMRSILNNGITRFAGKQLAVVSSLIILTLSGGYAIKALNLVYSPTGVVFGAGYTESKITLLFYKILIVACILVAVIIFVSILLKKIKPIVVSIVVIFLLMFTNVLVSGVYQNFIVKSNERNLETPYIKYNIDFTRSAFNIGGTKENAFSVTNDLTKEDIKSNAGTIDNIKVNSFTQALEFYNQTEVLKYYYKFNDLDVDRYNINGKGTQVFLAPREMDITALDSKTSTWANKHLVYTHGYGVVMNNVNAVTTEGRPDFTIKDIPIKNNTDIKIDNPRIYFGEKTDDYAIVDNTLGEFDYAENTGNKTNNYEGTAGIKMTMANKILFALNQGDMSFLLSKNITADSKILINRNVMDRVKKIAPFLTYDSDPYIVLSGGKVYWVIDAYTTSDRYPYSQPDESGVNYIRNSIKVVVDAVNGTSNFYVVDKNDPIAASYQKIFPTLFKSIDNVPADIKEHFRYPEDMFKMQCNIMGKYHVTDSNVFYNGDDLWQIAQNQKQVDGQKDISNTSYVYMRMPNETKDEMVLTQYFNVRNKDNMTALFAARMDGENYGKLDLYKFESPQPIYSPYLFKQNLNQDTTISAQISLWDKQGSSVIYGDTIILPIKNSLIYVEPIYLRASGTSSIPEMKRVVVSFGDKTVIAENIDAALSQIFNIDKTTDNNTSVTPGKPSTGTTAISNEKLKEAKDLYDKSLDAQKSGDWAKYGDYIKQLGQLLNDLSK